MAKSFSTAEVLDFVMDEGENDFVDTFQQGSDDEIGFLDDEEDEDSRDDDPQDSGDDDDISSR